MNHLIKNISISLVLGAVWAVITKSVLSVNFIPVSIILPVFYPLLFTGFLFISSLYFDLEIGLSKILITGASSGFVYYLLSLYFPLISIVLITIIISAGFVNHKNITSGFITSLIKGLIFIPVGIFASDVLIGIFSAFTTVEIFSWIILGSVLNVCFMAVIIPFTRLMGIVDKKDNNHQVKSEIDDFRAQTSDIIKEIESIRTI
ncbi:MAG: hypothetical protein GWO07_05330 [Candidatus Dadabacteria bacterium]|nr:hypothetical protein [Candidatus Dadabacteria bacterium]NIV41422.1 hypothetical protein [Candidatus Dadabacteria bacterium]